MKNGFNTALSQEHVLVKSHNFTNIYKEDLKVIMDESFKKQLNYSKALAKANEILLINNAREYDEPLTEDEKVLVYYIMFKIMAHLGQYKNIIYFGEYLLQETQEKSDLDDPTLIENTRLATSANFITKHYPGVLNMTLDDLNSFITYYDNYLRDFAVILLNAYVSEHEFAKAESLLVGDVGTTSTFIRLYLWSVKYKKDLKISDEIIKLLFETATKSFDDDISIILYDLAVGYTGYTVEEVRNEWRRRLNDPQFVTVKVQPAANHLKNVIVTLFHSGYTELTVKLLDMYCTYFIEERSFQELKNTILRSLKPIANELHKQILQSLQRGELYLEKIQYECVELTEAKQAFVQVKTAYLTAEENINQLFVQQKKDVLFNAIKDYLTEEQLEELSTKLFEVLEEDLKNQLHNRDKLDYHAKIMQNPEYFGSHWYKLDPFTQEMITVGLLLFDQYQAMEGISNDKLDYSPIIFCWCRALEYELSKRFFKPYVNYYKTTGFLPKYFEGKDKKPDCQKEQHLTLGSFRYLTGYIKGADRDTIKEKVQAENKEFFLKFISSNVLQETNDLQEYIEGLAKAVTSLAHEYRNKAAHTNSLEKQVADSCRKIMFPTQNLLIELSKRYKD